jgi:hypothetical protein
MTRMTHKRRDERRLEAKDDRLAKEADQRLIEPRSYAPPPCSLCTELRPPDESYSRVYATVKTEGSIVRYCRCDFCGNTYKDSRPLG